jgi:Tfp pilus assembly protein PilX
MNGTYYSGRFCTRRHSRERRGAVIVASLVCMLVVMAILGAMLRGTLRNFRQMRSERDLRQAELLLEAGSQRAAHKLAADSNYRGETWNLPADAIAGAGEGRVTIEVTPTAGTTPSNAKIVAEYPLGGQTSIRRSLVVQIPSQQTQK